jgi:hypothetical protein
MHLTIRQPSNAGSFRLQASTKPENDRLKKIENKKNPPCGSRWGVMCNLIIQY